MIQDTVVIGGECSLETRIEGDCDLTSMVEGDPDVLVVEGGGQTYPHYSGSYVVTPSASQQVLQTDGKVMDNDVTVQAVAQGSATTPATIITADPTISVSSGGLITATVSKTQQITPTVQEGYVSAGTPGNVGVAGSNTQQLTVQSAQTIHPSSTDQSIASGKYLTGAQTFKAVTVSGLTADKVLQGNVVKIGDADDDDRIMSVTGTASGGITPTGTKTITANGTGIDVYSYQYADVAVPNSYSASDEGKVVSNGALVSQTSDTVTENGTVDTTLIDELTVNVPTGGGGISIDDLATNTQPSGAITLGSSVTTVATYAFHSKPITSVSGAEVTTVKSFAFQNCSSLASATFPAVTSLEESAFKGTKLSSASFPLATSVGKTVFEGCQSLVSISLPSVTTPNNFAYNCQNLQSVDLSACTTVESGTFQQCYKLETLDLPACTKIKNNAFYNARVLKTLILRSNSVVTLDNIGAFANTPFRGYNSQTGTVYCPQSLISSYQQASNWSSLYSGGYCTFVKIEGSIYE